MTEAQSVSRLANLYIFSELYRREFIKSKTFSTADTCFGLQNKLMHIIKSSVNKIIESRPIAAESVGNITFKGASIYIPVLTPNIMGKKRILDGMITGVEENLRVGLNGVMNFSRQGNKIVYTFDDLYSNIEGRGYVRGGEEINLRAYLDSIVNAIIYLPSSINMILNNIEHVNKINELYKYKFIDLHYLIKSLSYIADARLREVSLTVGTFITTERREVLENTEINNLDHQMMNTLGERGCVAATYDALLEETRALGELHNIRNTIHG